MRGEGVLGGGGGGGGGGAPAEGGYSNKGEPTKEKTSRG